MSVKKPNELIHATSPYLLQHAYNPVNWKPWGPESLALAKHEDKPILVSIGYSSCHWCHVMERESFEHDSVAQIMNEYFVCIKVDREERPDIDQVYMEAVQAMGGHGGWPLNIFLTPDQKPFYGGTYFPPANWIHLLKQIHTTYLEKRADLEENAAQLTQHLTVSDLQRFHKAAGTANFSAADLEKMFSVLQERFDESWGGLVKAPKFVMPSIWLFLLRYHVISKNPDALQMVRHTLLKMQQGGLYDRLAGGFSRYSVDARWFAPHFEKMLYDNAQLVTLYSEAYAATKESSFKTIVYATISWLTQEMTSSEGGFYSALDADSENIEGKFYCWTRKELEEVLGNKTDSFASYFNVTRAGNWEHGMNILMDTNVSEPPPDILESLELLRKKRNTRVRPGLDDKILAGWNAMMITGLIDAYAIFGEETFLLLAKNCMTFLESNLVADGKFYRSFKNKRGATEGFLEDYAFLIQAYTALYQVTFDETYLRAAEQWTKYVIHNFHDAADGYFHFAGEEADRLITRKKELFDNVIPGSNSVMARNLYRLGTLLDKEEWKAMADTMAGGLHEIARSEPGYLSNWGILLAEQVRGLAEIVIAGKDAGSKRRQLTTSYIPFAVVLGTTGHSDLPLFEGRGPTDEKTKIYVCINKTCQLPVESVADALKQVHSIHDE